MSTIQNYSYIVAEDEPLIRKNIIKKIENLSMPFILRGEAGNGLDAIALIDQMLPDFVITDINMPQCDGLKVAEHISVHHPKVKTIILSGYSEFSFAQKALKYGVCDYILKPVKPEVLRASLTELLLHFETRQVKLTTRKAKPYELTQDEICQYVMQYLKKNYNEDISLHSLADSLGFTQEYIGKIFKKNTGQSPLKYLTSLRMNEAKQLLSQDESLEIGVIGELVGYRDAFYFSRAFKTYAGITPSEYRNQKNREV